MGKPRVLIELVGGPEDGHRIEVPDGLGPPFEYVRPRESLEISFTAPLVDLPTRILHDTYRIMLDLIGHYSRSDDGALRYHWVRP